jgi:DNA-damage-inducible protein D
MTDAELVFTALAEISTRQIAKTMETKGLEDNKMPARKGGTIAKNTRLELEQNTGKKSLAAKI